MIDTWIILTYLEEKKPIHVSHHPPGSEASRVQLDESTSGWLPKMW